MSRPESRRSLLPGLLAIAALALALRAAFPLADPPWLAPIGITWHDEGVWAHNARNRALFGEWILDGWNPLYVSPVFTALEFVSFSIFGVGLWQARVISMLAGAAAVIAIGVGLAATTSRRAALFGALLLAVNFTWVMFSKVALLEALMVAFIAGSWCAYTRAARSWIWGALAATLGLAAFFTKASAAFFLIALGISSCWSLWEARSRKETADWATLATLACGTIVALAVFVIPNWAEYSFYNLFVYGARRSQTGLTALMDRVSWFPVVHQFFSRQWLLTVVALFGLASMLVTIRRASAGERLLALWFVLGAFELVLHDLGNERRYVFLIPAMAGLAALALDRDRLLPSSVGDWPRSRVALAMPLVLAGAYVAAGSASRQFLMPDVSASVRSAAAIAVSAGLLVVWMWPRWRAAIASLTWSTRSRDFVVAAIVAMDATLVGHWAWNRTYKNVEASRAVGRLLPPGTLVQGKLANGLALDNGIRPLFIGPGFGNYADRFERPDVKWALTYSHPKIGYEGAVIKELLEASRGWTIVARLPVAETRSGADEAVLIRLGTMERGSQREPQE
jgi:4-amino-4-deoxy-L-arabinose transferase-like glycosyltransferase